MVNFNWEEFYSYRVFNEFLNRFVLGRKSYVTKHNYTLDIEAALEDIRARFVEAVDSSDSRFEGKVTLQFRGASELSKIVFANVEYLYSMPASNISPRKKRSYALRWFPKPNQVVDGERYFFGYPHTIANPGSYYLRNKYWEIVAILNILNQVTVESSPNDLAELKEAIVRSCYAELYGDGAGIRKFTVTRYCGIYSTLMHLAEPECYESIISRSHREKICAVYGHLVEDTSMNTEILLRRIREKMYDLPNFGDYPFRRYRWFFYSNDIQPQWINKDSKKEQRMGSAIFDVRQEEDAIDLEGGKEEYKGCRIRRSAKLVNQAKQRDNHACRACGFKFEGQIVHVHHLDPLSEYAFPKKTKLEDLITLCPTCHYLAHYWLRRSSRYKDIDNLLSKLQSSVSLKADHRGLFTR